MATINKHLNHDYTGGIPYGTGDRYYAQDLGRDFHFLRNEAGRIARDLFVNFPCLISGGLVSQGAGQSLNITLGYGYAAFDVTIPNTFAALPPSTMTATIDAVRVAWTAQTDLNGSSANCSAYTIADGATTYYVKVAYAEANGNTRARAKKAGTYNYEKTAYSNFIVNSSAPTDYEICLATLTSAGGTYTITSGYNAHSFVPVGLPGEIKAYAGVTVPAGYLLCDGSAISRTTYRKLFERIGISWGVGDSSTTFNIPNGQAVVLKGSGSQTINGRTKTGAALGVTSEDQFQGHRHAVLNAGGTVQPGVAAISSGSGLTAWVAESSVDPLVAMTITTGANGTPRVGDTTAENAIWVYYIIKY